MPDRHTIEISYCPRCGWLLRTAWMAQELLTTFWEDLAAVPLCPDRSGGRVPDQNRRVPCVVPE